MKVIFLDVDGVLNCITTKTKIEGYPFVDDEKVALLKEIINRTEAKVVLSSTWRYGWYVMDHLEKMRDSDLRDVHMFEALRDKLLEYGIELLGYTEDFGRRGDEISAWLKKWTGEPIESYVVLDDMASIEIRPHCKYLVQTSLTHGLGKKEVEQAIRTLNKDKSPRIPDAKPEQNLQIRRYPHNLMRKHHLFKKLHTDIELFIHQYVPIFDDDAELVWLMDNLQRRVEEIEKKLNPEKKE